MDIMDIITKGLFKITKNYGKKIAKKKTAPEIKDVMPTVISGSTYRAGYAKADISPDLNSGKTYYIAGHGSGHAMDGVISPVYTSAVWLDCGGEEGIIWISADIIGLTHIEGDIVREKIKASGVVPENTLVNISCTHSHSGIDTIGYWGKTFIPSVPTNGKDADYMKMLLDTMADVAVKAYQDRKEGKLYSGSVEVKDGLHSKRKFVDKHEILSRIRFAPNDGGREIWMMNFGAHPNTLGGKNRKLSGEYPYFMREEIAKTSNADVHYGIGPIGGMDAAQLDMQDKLHCVQLQGKMLADAVLKIENEKELEPQIKHICQPFYLPVSNHTLVFLAMNKVMSCNPYPHPDSALGLALLTDITYMTFGDQKILLLPGENFVSTVFGSYNSAETSATGKAEDSNPLPLAEIAGDRNIIVYGVSNDMTGYVVPENDFILNKTQAYLNVAKDRFGDKHYHETNGMGPNAQRYIADTFAKVVKNFG